MQEYQTIIIGAGPAGLIAGRHLKNALILDKKKEIGKPVQCGEGVSENALELQGIEPDDSWISCKIHKMERITPSGKVIGKFHEEAMGYVIKREKFEKYLTQDLRAEIKLNTKVIDLKFENNLWEVIIEGGEKFKSKYIIGADGPASVVRRKVFPESQDKIKFVPAVQYLIKTEKELDDKTIKIYLDNEKYNHGYAWIFPKSKNTANVGIGSLGNFSKELNKFLEEVIKKNYGDYEIIENRSGTIPVANISQCKLYKNEAFLVGDAAGLADPIFKGGISQAMMSGKIAGECILENNPDSYEAKIKTMPFADEKLIKASEIFYGFDNEVLDELGNVFENKELSYAQTFRGALKVLSRSAFLKNIKKFFMLVFAWKNSKDCM
ncbi:MAG: NAD(P)/FAD-dependent oxidoreductase [Candidatus Pacebacteria bacterium]|nr:NAD(P)/FAD-dependent oxidoreductase [Candidatus Paceibacterota bacterium]